MFHHKLIDNYSKQNHQSSLILMKTVKQKQITKQFSFIFKDIRIQVKNFEKLYWYKMMLNFTTVISKLKFYEKLQKFCSLASPHI